jgi:hypothetical protein
MLYSLLGQENMTIKAGLQVFFPIFTSRQSTIKAIPYPIANPAPHNPLYHPLSTTITTTTITTTKMCTKTHTKYSCGCEGPMTKEVKCDHRRAALALFFRGFLMKSRTVKVHTNLCVAVTTIVWSDVEEVCGENCPRKNEKELAALGLSYVSKN